MKNPSFTIVIPVYNGGDYLKSCIESVLAQTFGDFQVEILESLSTDGSYEWLMSLHDPRIRIWQATTPLTIEQNWQRISTVPLNEFLTILGQDDLFDPNYLQVMDASIRQYPEAGLYCAHFRIIDRQSRVIRSCLPMPARETAAEFLASRLVCLRESFATGYMMRSADYLRVGGIPLYRKLLFADDALWLLLMESSWKATALDECFSYRLHEGSASYSPPPQDVLAALEQYARFLEHFGADHREIAEALRKYSLRYVSYFYKFVVKYARQQNILPPQEELRRISLIFAQYSPPGEFIIKEKYNVRLIEWIKQTPLKQFAPYLLDVRYDFTGRLRDKAFAVCYLGMKLIRQGLSRFLHRTKRKS